MVIGTRPEAIKLAPVVRELERAPGVEARLCVTGQHRALLHPTLELFSLEPHHDLAIMEPGQSINRVSRAVLAGLEEILAEEEPDWVVVQGDTTTAMAASLAAFWHRTAIAHVEAGLRTANRFSPFPEEVNRRVTAIVADLHFCPTDWAAGNLRREGVPAAAIHVTGNTVVDALLHVSAQPFDPRSTPLAALPLADGTPSILVSAHRRESFGEGMRQIATAVRRLAEDHPDLQIAYLMHLNPLARTTALELLAGLPNVCCLQPLDYPALAWLLHAVTFVMTDSGGLQEEAAAVGKPVLVLRDTTERPEAVEAGIARVVGTRSEGILREATALLADAGRRAAIASIPSPYGDGNAAVRVVAALRAEQARRDAVAYAPPRLEDAQNNLVVPDAAAELAERAIAAPVPNAESPANPHRSAGLS